MRTRKKKWTQNELASNPNVLADPSVQYETVREIFKVKKQTRLELGCGKGRFILQCAEANPSVRFVAVERDPTILAAASRISKASANPPVFILSEASEIEKLFLPGELDLLHINFCDPWPNKKKWAKRRLTHERYLFIYEKLLIPEIHFKTDSRLLFDFSIESFLSRNWKLTNISYDYRSNQSHNDFATEYEEKFTAQGLPVYRFEASFPSAQSS